MPQYWISIHHPDNYDPSSESDAMSRDIDVLNWVQEATDMNEALTWGRKAAVACRAPVEVRQFHSWPVE